MVLARVRIGLACLAVTLCASVASAQTAPTLAGGANGLAISLSWTPVPGATGYDVMVGVGTTVLPAIPVGNVLALNVPGVPPGTYQVAVRATAGPIAGPASNILTIAVTGAPVAPPEAPTNLSATVNGLSVLLSWDLATTSGLTGLVLQAGNSEGASDLGTFPIRTSTSSFLGALPAGNYFLRLFAVNAGGPSPASNELNLALPGCVAPSSIPFNVSSNGGFVQASWPQVPGATGYRLDASSTPGGGPDLASVNFPATQTSFSTFGIATGTYYLKLHATLSCGVSAASAEQPLNVTAPVRQPAKSFDQARAMVLAAGAATPGIGSSCGNTTWLFGVTQRLRQQDDRFGNNWKRGNVGDMSQDVILYNFSDLPNEQAHAAQVYAWDVIGGHCGPNPSPQANNITDARGAAGWTILKYLQAGFAP
jgi:hypothetical protein